MPLVHISTRRLEYKFEISQKYNLLIGDSGSGKTKLVDMVYAFSKDRSAIQCYSYDKLLTDRNLSIEDLVSLEDYIVFLDEDSPILHRADVSKLLEMSQNYFVIICRDISLGFKSISLDCVFKLKTSGKYHTFENVYSVPDEMIKPDMIICEDSNSGFQFMQKLVSDTDVRIDFARSNPNDKTGGKSKIAECLNSVHEKDNVCIVFDKSAIAFDYPRILNSITKNKLNVCYIDWDSFETYILESPMFRMHVPEPEDKYESKEILANELISNVISYQKHTLSKCLQADFCKSCIDAYKCKYCHYVIDDLIYWKVKGLLQEIKESMPSKMDL